MAMAPGSSVVSEMLQFYGLREHPFGVSPDPRFLYPSFQHREAMASLIFGIESHVGFAALIAEPGAGKTTLLFDILQRYRERASTAFVFNTQCSGPELLRQVVLELQIPGGDLECDPLRLHQLFTMFVVDSHRTKPVVIIIDEAQNLENSALEALRLLSNFEAANRKLLHIILAGQPQLAARLRHPSLTQLLQRITNVIRLERFSQAQMEECIAFRLRVAGFAGPTLFSWQAMARITAASGGVPREINRICINAMQLGFALRQRPIGLEVIEEVIADLTLARWIPDAELPAKAIEAPEVPNNSPVGFRVAAQIMPEPLREKFSETAAPAVRAGAKASSLPEKPLEAGWTQESWIRRVLRLALEHRRRAKELQSLHLESRAENDTSASNRVLRPVSSAVYPYQFAMGCVPSPTVGKQGGPGVGDEQSRVQIARAGEAHLREGQTKMIDEREANKKTGTW